MQQAFAQVAGFMLLIVMLTFANRTKIGHVIIYYSLLLMILTIVVTEAPAYAALLGNMAFSPHAGSLPNTSGPHGASHTGG
jgi:hypothetical protein